MHELKINTDRFFYFLLMSVSAQTMLDNLETAINNMLAGGAVQSYSIAGRNLQRMSLKELMDLRNSLRAEIARSGSAGTGALAEFSEPG